MTFREVARPVERVVVRGRAARGHRACCGRWPGVELQAAPEAAREGIRAPPRAGRDAVRPEGGQRGKGLWVARGAARRR